MGCRPASPLARLPARPPGAALRGLGLDHVNHVVLLQTCNIDTMEGKERAEQAARTESHTVPAVGRVSCP